MTPVDYDVEPAPPSVLADSWLATLVLGVLTLILGIIVSFHPSGSLNVVAVLFGILMILSGIFHLMRIFDRDVNGTGSGLASLACSLSSSASS